MACGTDLETALQTLECPLSKEIDCCSLDWLFEDPELEKFLNKFCLCTKLGQLRNVSSQNNGKSFMQRISLSTILKEKSKGDQDIMAEIEKHKIELSYKEEYADSLRHILKVGKIVDQKYEEKLSLSKKATSRSNLETNSVRKEFEPFRIHICKLLKYLLTSRDQLLNVLQTQSEDLNNLSKTSSSCLLNVSSQSHEHGLYLKKEEVLFKQIETRVKQLQNQSLALNVDYLQEWRSELTRLNKSFFLSIQQFNIAAGTEAYLQKQINHLRNKLSQDDSKDLFNEIQQTEQSLKTLNEEFNEALPSFSKTAEELASKDLSPLILLNYSIKLQRLEQFSGVQLKLLHVLREQQCRLSFLRLCHKFEGRRNTQLIKICNSVSTLVRKHTTVYLERIDILNELIARQETKVIEAVPEGDETMETIGEILETDQEELIKTFSSIIVSAQNINSQINCNQEIIQNNYEIIMQRFTEMEICVNLLDNIQKTLSANTNYHGNLQLCQAMSMLKSTYMTFADGISKVNKEFEQKLEDLKNSPREVFARSKRIHEILNAAG